MSIYWDQQFSGPLGGHFEDLHAGFSTLGYAPSTVRSHLALWAQVSRWLESQGMAASEWTPDKIGEFLQVRARTHRHLYSIKALSPGLELLRRAGAVPEIQDETAEETSVEAIARRFRYYLLVERGLTKVSAQTYVVRARAFLDYRAGRGWLDLGSLTAADVTGFIAGWFPRLSKATARSTVTALRSLLSFLHATGVVTRPLASVVPTVASWKMTGLPIGLTPVQVQTLLDACDQSTPVGRRDFAILTLLARLGLRAGEVAGLRLEDIDWRAGTMTVHGKGNSDEQLPLPVDVGTALAHYLEHGRFSSGSMRAVFIRAKAPYRALSHKSISTMVARRARRTGLGTVHAHLLRHTLATEVLRQGASLDEVGQLLRHRSRASTEIYAKVDQHRLLQIAQPWPTSGGPR